MPVYYSQEINVKNSISAFNEGCSQQMRNDKATVPINHGADINTLVLYYIDFYIQSLFLILTAWFCPCCVSSEHL